MKIVNGEEKSQLSLLMQTSGSVKCKITIRNPITPTPQRSAKTQIVAQSLLSFSLPDVWVSSQRGFTALPRLIVISNQLPKRLLGKILHQIIITIPIIKDAHQSSISRCKAIYYNLMKSPSAIVIQNESNQQQYLAFLFIIMSQIIFPISWVYVNQHNVHPVESGLARGVAFTLVSFLLGKRKNVSFQKSINTNFNKFLLRNSIVVVHFLSMAVVHYYLPLSLLHTLNCSGPIFVFVWDYLLHGIQINQKQFIGVLLGCLGVLLAINGERIYQIFDDQFETKSKFENFILVPKQVFFFISLGFVGVNFMWAYSASMIKTIKMKDASEMMYHFGIILIFLNALSYSSFVIEPKSIKIYLQIFIFSSLPASLAQYLFTQGLSMTRNSGVASIFMFITVIIGYTLSIFRYDEATNPIGVIGSILIISGLTIVIFWKENIDKTISLSVSNPESRQTKLNLS